MTTQTQGKGKKKNKEVIKFSLDEFNQIDAPHGHSVVSLKTTGLDWAATMADYEQSSETQQIIVPTAPRAQRGPGVDFDSLPNEPPFRVSLFNVPMSVEEKEICERFFQNIDVTRVDISKSNTTVELATKNDLYEALCKDGSNLKGRQISVCMYGETPRDTYGSDRYGGRGGNSSYGDRYGDRSQGGFSGQRSGDRYGDRSSGFGRDRDNYSGFSRGGFGQQRAGYGDRFNDRGNFRDRGQYTSGGGEPESEEPTNWRARPSVKPLPPSTPSTYNNGSRQPYIESRSEPAPHYHNQPASHAPTHQQYHQPEPYYQPRNQQHHNQQSNNTPFNSQYNDQASSNNRPSSSEVRPKLVLAKRKTPINVDDTSSVTRNEAIFGQAKPSSTPYQKMNEVEEKLKAVQITDRKEIKSTSQAESQVGSQPGSAPRSRRVSSTHSESNS